MNPEGAISVRLACGDGRVRRVDVASSRTGLPMRLVQGRTPDEVERLVPLLFSICRRAQGAAASAALAAARGDDPAPHVARHARAVVVETLHEGVWRLLIDWPKTMGEPTAVPAVAAVRRAADAVVDDGATLDALLGTVDDVLREHVYGVSAAEWLAADEPAALDRWIERGATVPARLLRRLREESPGLGRSDVALMPAATADRLPTAVVGAMDADADFARFPRWGGAPAETGALARQADNPLIAALIARDGRTAATRFAARLVELAALTDELRLRAARGLLPVRAHALGPGDGLGLAETARGLLLHRAGIDGDAVRTYRIVAPTEWNFHPCGPLAQGLEGRGSADRTRLEREARIVVQSLDPCVACAVEVIDA